MKTAGKYPVTTVLLSILILTGTVTAAQPTKLDDLPVREVTVFKDGHAFVLHEGKMTADEQGDVVMDYLPRPIIGTFWVYSADESMKLRNVVSGSKIVTLGRTAMTTAELIEANAGKRVRFRDTRGEELEGVIIGVPKQTTDELAKNSVPGTSPQLPIKGQVVLLRIAEGIKVVELSSLQEVTFLDEPASSIDASEFRNLMTLRFGKEKAGVNTDVGMMYVQRGIRWIPSYRVEIDGKGKAVLKLQATIINELKDLSDVKAHLVIGVPSFAFKDTVDPMSMQETVARLGSVFNNDSRSAYAYSNGIMTQQVRMSEYDGSGASVTGDVLDLGPEVAGAQTNEDLFVFTLEHVTLRKGERMVMPIAEYSFDYKDIYKLDLPFSPPGEMMNNIGSEQQLEMARLMSSPKVKHTIRFTNSGKQPITTAPATVVKDGQVLSQGMTQYTAPGNDCDLELTVAVNLSVRRTDTETGRQPNAINTNGRNFEKVSLAGNINVVNRGEKAVEVEVKRSVLGKVISATSDGVITQIGPQDWGTVVGELPGWWRSYGWPGWWYNVNSIGSIKWVVKIEAGKTADLGYEWSYFWCW
jgi:hypothetical protein